MPALTLDRLSKSFGTLRALNEVTFSIEQGEVFGYLGPNGAGKTTTLRCILGLVHPDSGSITIHGKPVSDPQSRDDAGFLPGEFRLWGELSGRAVLDHFARYRPNKPPKLRGQVLDALGMDDATLRRRVKVLSHGTRQKLGLAIAMQHDPSLLLLDEPSIGLDPIVQRGFRELVQDFAARGAAVLFSSHVLSEVEEVCRRVAIVRGGKIVAVESVDALRRLILRPLTIRFRHDIPAGLELLPGVEHVETNGREAVLRTRGDVNAVLRFLAGHDVDDVIFPEPQLEDAFMEYYESRA
jgi:ABC-2 type transport system ATP-binding protein